ncbi:hypothetical protein [Mesorhizobium sp. WSM3860]|uniref:hypothetical protein n=1 Tax=Mesorhizobium sp. WSM3860 TaxID=2029403 RepID=UPI00159706A0|nr:hypothetical protein [Mesorhizobium sp. WSM3860]
MNRLQDKQIVDNPTRGWLSIFSGLQARKENGALDVGVEGTVGPGLMGIISWPV